MEGAREGLAQRFGVGLGCRVGDVVQGTDPFGNRPNGHSGSDTSRIEIPDAAEAARLKNLLDELRNRASDMSRPQSERDYLDRLLKWF